MTDIQLPSCDLDLMPRRELQRRERSDLMGREQKILMVVTSHAQLGSTSEPTGFWLEELAAPYFEFVNSGAEIQIASPKGGRPPADPRSEDDPPKSVQAFLADRIAVERLSTTARISDLTPDYDAYFVVGGHGAMWDLSEDAALAALLSKGFESQRVIAAVCHGPAALVNVRLSDGSYLVAGKRACGFTNQEEAAVGLDGIVPFALETVLRQRGAKFESGPMWSTFAVRDGKLVTGQNPASSAEVARETLKALCSP